MTPRTVPTSDSTAHNTSNTRAAGSSAGTTADYAAMSSPVADVSSAGEDAPPVRWSRLLARPGFAAYLLARAASDFGDRLAKVAVSLAALVSTGSILAAAAVFAAATLPSVFADTLLSPLADRLPRRAVMIGSDLIRAGLVLTLVAGVLAHVPVWLLIVGVFAVEVVAAPFYAAGAGLMAELLPEPAALAAGNALRWAVQLAAMVLGWAAGGVLVAKGGAHVALLVDVATFVVSAGLLAWAVPVAVPTAGGAGAAGGGSVSAASRLRGWFGSPVQEALEGWQAVRSNPDLLRVLVASWLSSVLLVVPGALAFPVAVVAGRPEQDGSLLLAAEAAGTAVGVVVLARWSLSRQRGACWWLVCRSRSSSSRRTHVVTSTQRAI